MAIPKSTMNAEPGTPGTTNFSNLHKPQAAHRGFVLWGLSYAKRRPKLFTKEDRQLSVADMLEMVYRGGCVAEYAIYLERSPSTYDEQMGSPWPQGVRKER